MTIKYSSRRWSTRAPACWVLGSLPARSRSRRERYYANPQNQLWWPDVAGDRARPGGAWTMTARLAAMLAARVGLWDVVASARRDGSTDAAIRDLVANDLAGSSARCPSCARSASTAHLVSTWRAAAGRTPTAISPSSPCLEQPAPHVGAEVKQPAWNQLRAWLN